MENRDEAAPDAGVAEAVSYAASHGIIVSQSSHSAAGTNLSHAPLTYKPTPFHAPSYHHAIRITPPLNTMVANIAADHSYLRTTLAETAAADADFTGRLLALLGTAPATPSVGLSICRFDYFVHRQHAISSLRMVEMNCIAASFACLGTKTSEMHRFLATHPACNLSIDPSQLPNNEAMQGLARGIALAHNSYRELHLSKQAARSAAIMIVQPGDCNAYDQDLLRVALWDVHKVEMIRVSLAEVNAHATIQDRHMMLDLPCLSDPVVVTVAYFRAGYSPDDYISDKEWHARGLIEQSLAAKCPTVAMQLVGTKKVQQVLDLPGQVERFVDNAEDAKAIRSTFARQYSLSAAENGERTARLAIDAPEDYVLKPQREGGGNNLYSDDMKKALETMSEDERSAFVLMERIRPVITAGVLLREGKKIETDIVSEFGVYGVHVTVGKDVIQNLSAGTLLRSKAANQDDGGVAAGVAVLDSPMLVD